MVSPEKLAEIKEFILPRKFVEEICALEPPKNEPKYIGAWECPSFRYLLKEDSQFSLWGLPKPTENRFHVFSLAPYIGTIKIKGPIGRIQDRHGWATMHGTSFGNEIFFVKQYSLESLKNGGRQSPMLYHGTKEFGNFGEKDEYISGLITNLDEEPSAPLPFLMTDTWSHHRLITKNYLPVE